MHTDMRQVPGWRLRDRLVRAREHAGFDQAQLADRIGVSRNSVSNYERGVRVPTAALIEAWSEATNVDANWITEGESERSEADDLVDEIARLVALRARRDSNPQPSDLESAGYYACPFCHVDFTGSESLSKHITVVHGSKSEWAVAA